MPTPTYTALAHTTLSNSSSQVIFSSIPNTYKDLIITVRAKNNGSGTVTRWQFNSDTGANYSIQMVTGEQNAVVAIRSSTTWIEPHYYSDLDNSWSSSLMFQILDYSATNKNKSCLIRNAQVATERGALMAAARWGSNNAINSIRIFLNTGAFDTGSSFALYGISG